MTKLNVYPAAMDADRLAIIIDQAGAHIVKRYARRNGGYIVIVDYSCGNRIAFRTWK